MRPTLDEYFMNVAKAVATRSTCLRRQVGAVLVDKNGHILSTGYNGKPRGFHNCTDESGGLGGCVRENSKSGADLDKCLVVHAEQNALLQCGKIDSIYSIYATIFPCVQCIKLLMNTSCYRIVFCGKYSLTDELVRMWSFGLNREVYQLYA